MAQLDLKRVEYFVRVAELGSFTRAALMLGLSQPSLSRQIRLLETEVHQSLLHRHGRGVELTPAGQCMLEHGHALLGGVQRAIDALNELGSDPRGRVVVGLPYRTARLITTPLVQAFRGKFPHASITVAEGLSTVLHEWILSGRVDVALLFDPPRSSELDLELLLTEELVLVGPRAKRATLPKKIELREIVNFPLILPRIPNATRSVLEAATGRAGIKMQLSVEVDTIHNILELIGGHMGYGILPVGAVTHSGGEERFQIARIHAPVLRQRLFFAAPRHRPQTRLAAEIRQMLQKVDFPKAMGGE